MSSGRDTEDPIQPQVRNPAADPDTSPEKQSELKLNVGIGIIGTILSIGVALIFYIAIGEVVLGVIFTVVAIAAAAVTAYAFVRRRRGQEQQHDG